MTAFQEAVSHVVAPGVVRQNALAVRVPNELALSLIADLRAVSREKLAELEELYITAIHKI